MQIIHAGNIRSGNLCKKRHMIAFYGSQIGTDDLNFLSREENNSYGTLE